MGILNLFRKKRFATNSETFDFLVGIYNAIFRKHNKDTKIDSISLLITLANTLEIDNKKINPNLSDSIKVFADFLDANDTNFPNLCEKYFNYANEYSTTNDNLTYDNFLKSKLEILSFMKLHGLDLQ